MPNAQSARTAADNAAQRRPSAAEPLATSSIWYQALFEQGTNAILLLDAQTGQVIAANPAACRMFGYTETEFRALDGLALLATTDPNLAAALAARDPAASFRSEFTACRADGTRFPVELVSSSFTGPDGTLVSSNLFLDISERRAAEAALRESEARYHDLYEQAPDMYLSVDAQSGRIVQCNETAARITGFAKDEIVGRPVFEMYHPACLERARQVLQTLAATGSVRDVELQVCCKDGSVLDVSLNASAVVDAAGNFVRTRSIWRDITERKEAERALRDSEERFRLVAQNTPNIITIWGQDGILQYISPAVAHVLGRTPEETIRLNATVRATAAAVPGSVLTPEDLVALGVHPDDAANGARMLAAVAYCSTHLGEPVQVDTRSRTASGGYRDLETVYQGILHSTLGSQVVSVTTDVTEHKTLERMLQDANAELEQRVTARTAELAAAMEDLKKAAQLKDEFMAAVSHELRTPLTGVLGMAEALEMQFAGPLNERQMRYVHAIYDSGNRLLSLVNRILNYTALLGGRVSVQVELCPLGELCAAALRPFREHAVKKGQTVALSIEPPALALYSDRAALIQVLENLLDNAVKFTPDGGRIGLEARRDDRQACVHLVVWDTGIGIAEEQRTTIFQPLVQADASLARRFQGIGLGLSLVQGLVELLGGTIAVASEPGKGSRFTVTLPAQPPAK